MNSHRIFQTVTRLSGAQINLKAFRLVPSTSAFCTQPHKPQTPQAPVEQTEKKKATAVPPPVSKSSNLSVISVLKGLKDSPSPALVYGLSGLIPFVAVPVYTITSGCFCPMMGSMQLYYGASILSFLGGIRWGNSLQNPSEMSMENIGYSVVPSLVACGALAMPYAPGMLTVAAGLGSVAYLDLHKTKSSYPPWFKSMRLVLSSVAVASLMSALLLSYTHKKQKAVKEAQT